MKSYVVGLYAEHWFFNSVTRKRDYIVMNAQPNVQAEDDTMACAVALAWWQLTYPVAQGNSAHDALILQRGSWYFGGDPPLTREAIETGSYRR